MPDYELIFNRPDNTTRTLTAATGKVIFILGANGTGKSTLIQIFASQHRGHVRRLTAHRQIWFHSDTIDLTPQSRQQTENQIISADTQTQSRWRDDHAAQRAQAVVFDLIDSENVEARGIAAAARAGNMERVQELASSKSPIAQMNDILRVANLRFEIAVQEGSKLTAARDGLEPYSIAELSDGERNALLTAANVLTARPDSLILIDEPERHLHRAVVSPLITTLLSHRPDCAFVISTHDVGLPLDQPECSALLVRKFMHQPQSWNTDFVEKVEELDELTAEAVLGARRLLLFVEGTASSLDLQLYQLLFPEISVRPAGTCADVERTVKGLRAAGRFHWLTAIGLVDRDNRPEEECRALADQGLVALKHYSVESLYYHPQTIEAIARRFIEDTDGATARAMQGVLNAFAEHADRLAARMVERQIRNELLSRMPDWRDISTGNADVDFDGAALYQDERNVLDGLLAAEDVGTLISRYPIRETPATTGISRALGFHSCHTYEAAVRKLLSDSPDERARMRVLLEPLSKMDEISGAGT